MLITVHLAFMDIFGKYRPGFCEYHKTSLMEGRRRYADYQRQTCKSLPWIRDEENRKIKTRSTSRIRKNERNTCFREQANDTVTPAIQQFPLRTIPLTTKYVKMVSGSKFSNKYLRLWTKVLQKLTAVHTIKNARTLWNWKVQHRGSLQPPLKTILSQMNPVYTLVL